jgi:ABC-type lipoprotein export system ATPase subunit
MNPPLLLAAEPTGNLDSKSASGVFDLLRGVNRDNGMAILFVTHNAALATRSRRAATARSTSSTACSRRCEGCAARS